jgi:ectoine hydroxylase-related dioxygenase (phytanoyl-CoA dioxygenase family)
MTSSDTAASQIDIAQYRRDGFLTAPSVFTPDELQLMRDAADEVLTRCAAEPERYARRIEWERDHVDAVHQATMDRVIRKLEPVSDIAPVFARYSQHPGIVDPLKQIFADDVCLFEDKLNLKLPGGSPYPWHQDWACCWRAHTDELITCFVYLDDADETMGCLQVIPGSHQGKPILPFKEGGHFEIDPAAVPAESAVPVPLKAGGMIYFDPYLLHYSDYNTSTRPRRTIIFTYNPARLGDINQGRFPDDRIDR